MGRQPQHPMELPADDILRELCTEQGKVKQCNGEATMPPQHRYNLRSRSALRN